MISIFKMGVILLCLGIVWIGFILSNDQVITQSISLEVEQTKSIDFELQGTGTAYYKVAIGDIGDSVFVQILDSSGNVISDRKIATKLVINYFNFKSDNYVAKITNLGEDVVVTTIDISGINSKDMTYPGIILIAGIVIMMIQGYRKLYYYKTEQPDENI